MYPYALKFAAGPFAANGIWDIQVTCTPGTATPNFETLVGTVPELLVQLGERFCSYSQYPIPRPTDKGALGGSTRLTTVGDFPPALLVRLGWALNGVSLLYMDLPDDGRSVIVKGVHNGSIVTISADGALE